MGGDFNWSKWYTPRIRVVSHIVFWLVISALYYINYNRLGGEWTWVFVAKELFVTGSLYYSASWIISRWVSKGKLYPLLVFFVFAYLWWVGWTYLLCYSVEDVIGKTDSKFNNYIRFILDGGFWGLFHFKKFAALILDFMYMAAIPLAPKLTKVVMDGSIKMVKLERDNLAMELDFLKSQVSPHLLFNILNSIYRMSTKNDPNTSNTVLQLSKLMRYVLYEGQNDEISLRKEVEFINNYIELVKLRYAGRVPIETDIETINEPYSIIPLVLIPLVENAFKHGPDRSRNGAWVNISLRLDDDTLFLSVSNGVNNNAEKPLFGGVGLPNMKRRLQLHYPERHSLNIKETDNSFAVDLIIKLK